MLQVNGISLHVRGTGQIREERGKVKEDEKELGSPMQEV